MKNFVILLTLLCCCCTLPPVQTTPRTVQNNSGEDEIVQMAHEFTYKGHSYIIFTTATRFNSKYCSTGVVHNPECKCFTDSLNKVN